MKEDLVTYEIAQILKSKNIIIDSDYKYTENGILKEQIDEECIDEVIKGNYDYLAKGSLRNLQNISKNPCGYVEHNEFLAPTLYQVQKYLREVYYINVIVTFADNMNVYFYFVHTNSRDKNANRICSAPNKFDNYEKALEEGIKQALDKI